MNFENKIWYLLGSVEGININIENGVEYTKEQLIEELINIEERLLEATEQKKYRPCKCRD